MADCSAAAAWPSCPFWRACNSCVAASLAACAAFCTQLDVKPAPGTPVASLCQVGSCWLKAETTVCDSALPGADV